MDDAYVYYAALKSVWMLSRWIEEEKEDTICDHFNVGPGDLYRYAESAQWMLYATGVIAEMLNMKKLTFIIENLRRRIRYGIREELLNLCQLNGVGRVRARILHKKGFTQPPDFKYTTAKELGAIKGIGKVLAEEIIRQVNDTTLRRKAKSYL